jgi:hypothetical protein
MPEDPHVLSLTDCEKLDQAQVAELVKSIRQMPGKSLTLSVAEYRALTNFSKGMFLHKGGRVTRRTMAREAFEKLTPRSRMEFMKQGGKLL